MIRKETDHGDPRVRPSAGREDRGGRDEGREDRGDRMGKDDDDRGGRRGGGFHRKKVCRFCSDQDFIMDYKDQRMMQSFVTEHGKIVPRRISGNCANHQRQLTSDSETRSQFGLGRLMFLPERITDMRSRRGLMGRPVFLWMA